jgi:hypothetical protein
MASTTHTSTGSKSLFSGEPAFIASTYDWADQFEEVLGRAIESAKDFASKSLRYGAQQDDAWKPFVNNLSVEYADGAFHYVLSGTPEEIQAMTDLEYGTPSQPASPLLRPQLQRQNDILAHRIDLILAQESPVA